MGKSCYIISQIGDPDTPERKWADFIRQHIIKPAVTDCDYEEPARADDPDKDLIMTDIIQQMFDADLVVADLTDCNPNVCYELGIRHCAKKPTIHLIKTGQLPPFDLGGNKAIFVDETHVTVTKAIEDIKARIKAIKNDPNPFYSQVHLHIELNKLQIREQGGTATHEPLVPLLSDMVVIQRNMSEQLTKLSSEIAKIPKKVGFLYEAWKPDYMASHQDEYRDAVLNFSNELRKVYESKEGKGEAKE